MSLIKNFFGSSNRAEIRNKQDDRTASLQDEAIDTLGCFIWTFGQESFPVDNNAEPDDFAEQCNELALHVKIGTPVPAAGIDQSADGTRAWPAVRRFFVDRRKQEREFVSKRLGDYRGIVNELVSGLRELGNSDQCTEDTIRAGLGSIETAVDTGTLPAIKLALSKAIEDVSEALAKQKEDYEQRIAELNERMSSLRDDLVSTQEEMKRDALTEVYNRGAFDSAIQHSVNMRFVAGQAGTLVLIDVDHFKQINDEFGHASGDAVLKAIATCLERSFIRRSDLVSRFGGDEFAVILNDTNNESSAPIIERFRSHLGSVAIADAPPGRRVTCSIGYTDIGTDDDVATLLNRADKALYRAKRDGRSCVRYIAPTQEPARSWSPPTRPPESHTDR
jgi:diguanylate cyclase